MFIVLNFEMVFKLYVDEVKFFNGMDITIVTTANTDEEAQALLEAALYMKDLDAAEAADTLRLHAGLRSGKQRQPEQDRKQP